MFGKRQRGFTNWAGNQRCDPLSIERPESVDELARLVEEHAARGERVKPVGAGHSFSGAAMTEGTIVDLRQLGSVHTIDTGTGRVVAGAGISLAALNRTLHAHGRALPNLGDIDAQSLAGATATGTHGTGSSFGNISTRIVGLELVTGTGEVVWCDASTRAELFSAARVGLGALGIVTRIALDTVPAFNLRSVETVEPVADVLADWPGFVASAEHVEFFWMPGSDHCLVKRNDRTVEEPSRRASVRSSAEKLVLENVGFGAAMRVVRRFPTSRDRVQSMLGSAMGPSTRVDVSHRVFATPRLVRFVEMEYGIPLDAVPEAFDRVRELVGSLADPPSFPVEVRTSAEDRIPLSMANRRPSGWIAVHRYRGLDFEPYFRGVESVMADYAGRPHWGKYHFQSADTLAPLYRDWDRFASVRATVDPLGTFRNPYLDRILDPLPG